MTLGQKLLALLGWTYHRCAVCNGRVKLDRVRVANVGNELRVVHGDCAKVLAMSDPAQQGRV